MGNGNQSLEEGCITLNKSVTQDQLLLVNTDCMVISLLNMVDLTFTEAGKVYRDKAGVVVGALGMERDYMEDQIFLLGRDDGGVGDRREVDPGVGDQVGLELVQIHVKGSIKPQRGGDVGHDLRVEAGQVGVGGALDIKVPPADVIDSLVVDHEGTVTVLEGNVGI